MPAAGAPTDGWPATWCRPRSPRPGRTISRLRYRRGRGRVHRRHLPCPGRLRCRPGPAGIGRVLSQWPIADLQHQVVVFAWRHGEVQFEPVAHACGGRSGPPDAQVPCLGLPCTAEPRPVRAEPGAWVADHAYPRRGLPRDDPAEQNRPAGLAREGQRLPALDDPAGGHPTGCARSVSPARRNRPTRTARAE